MTTRSALWRPLIVLAALTLAALACNLQRGEVEPTPATSAQVERPTVEILEPTSDATLVQGQRFSVKALAKSPSGITQVELLVNNIPVTTQPPAENLRPEELTVVLDYTPQQSGTLTLVVRAYSGGVTGQSAPLQVRVQGPLDPGQGGVGTPQPGITPTVYNPQCRARINTPLRFRAGPGTVYDIILTFQAGDEPPIIGYANQPDGQWWLVSSGGRTGWISAAYTTQMGNCAGVGPAQVPPPPTQPPTAVPPPTQPGATTTPAPPDLRLSVLEGPRDVTLDASGTIPATYIIRVRNYGGTPAGQFSMAAAVLGQQPRDLGIVSGLAPGQEVEVPAGGLTVTFNTPGLTRLLVTVDTGNTVAEGDEGNNQAYLDINVNPGVQAFQALPPVEAAPTQAPPQVAVVPTEAPTQAPLIVPTQPEAQALQAQPEQPAQQEAIPQVEQPPVEQPPVEQPPAEQPPVEEQRAAQEPAAPLPVIDAGNAPVLSELMVLSGHGGSVAGLAFSPLGGQLASGSWDGTIRLWDTATGQTINTLTGHGDRVTGVVYSPDGSRLVSGSWDGTVRLWDVASGQQIGMFEHGAEINTVAISFDGTRVAAGGLNPEGGGLDGRIRAWDLGSSALVGEIATYGVVSGIDFIGTDLIAVGSAGKSCSQGGDGVELYSLSSGEPALALEGDSGWINGLAVSADGALIAGTGQMELCGGNGAVWVWNSGTGQLQITLDTGGGSAATAVTFGASGQIVAAGGEDGTVRVWSTGSPAPLAALGGHNAVTSVAISPDGTLLASGGSDTAIRLWGVR
ncbi:MAG: CARDB domain-containing protein [Chloroflexota bacterium]